jgi:mannose-6-phosphate isomerase-like protein (cupin superfamily)
MATGRGRPSGSQAERGSFQDFSRPEPVPFSEQVGYNGPDPQRWSEAAMNIANWKTQVYNVVQSLLFNNPHRVIEYRVRDADGRWRDRAELPAPVRRLYETEAPPERTCLRTIQFVHHALIPPQGRHVAELHVHPDAEEIVVVTRGEGLAIVSGETRDVRAEDVVYIPPGAEHEFRNTGDDFLGVLFINVPTGEGLRKLLAATEGG